MYRLCILITVFVLLFLGLAACAGSSTLDEAASNRPRAEAGAAAAAQTAAQPITSTQTPFKIVTVMPDAPIPTLTPVCANTPPTRMIVHERGIVSDEDPQVLNVRAEPSTDAQIWGVLEVLQVFFVEEGPRCSDGYVWYRIRHERIEGWVAEGTVDLYFIEPYLPG